MLVCDWLHSVGQNHFYIMMLIIQGCCFIRSLHFSFELQRWLCAEFKAVSSVLLKPSERRELSFRTFLYVEKLQTVPSCIRSDVSAACPNAVQCSISYGISFQKHKYRKTAVTVQMMCILPSGRAHSQGKSCIQSSTVWTTIFMVRTLKLHIWKLWASDQPSKQQLLWSRRAKPSYGNFVQLKYNYPDARATPSGRG